VNNFVGTLLKESETLLKEISSEIHTAFNLFAENHLFLS